MHSRCARKPPPVIHPACRTARTNGFVILILRIAKGQIVHRALGIADGPQRLKDRVGHMLRGFHVSRHHRAGIGGAQHGSIRDDDGQGPQAPCIHRDRGFHHDPEAIQHRRPGHRFGRVEIVQGRRRGAGEIHRGAALCLVDSNFHPDHLPGVGRVRAGAIVQRAQQTRHFFCRIILHMGHIGADYGQAEIGDDLAQFRRPARVGCDLSFQIGDVLLHIADRIGVVQQNRFQSGVAELAILDQQQIVDQHPFFIHRGRQRSHRPGGRAAHIGMVPARGDPEQQLRPRLIEHRGHHGNVWQMRAAVIGRVQGECVARTDFWILRDHGFHRPVHRPQMDGHMRCIGDQRPGFIEHGAGKIQAFLDIDRMRRVLQRHPHLFGDVHEQVVEHLKQNRIGPYGACGHAPLQRDGAGQQDMVVLRDPCLPARFDDDGLVGLDDQGRAGDHRPGGQPGPQVNRRIMPMPAGIQRRGLQCRGGKGFGGMGDFIGNLTGFDAFQPHGFDGDGFVRAGKTELRQMCRLEGRPGGDHIVAIGYFNAGIGPVIPQMQRRAGAVRRNPLRRQIGLNRRQQLRQKSVQGGPGRIPQWLHQPLLARCRDPGQPDAIGRQQPRQRVDQHLFHPQRISDQTGMLPPRPAKAVQQIAGHVMAALDRDLLDRIGHVFDGNADEPFGGLFGGFVCRKAGKAPFHGGPVQRLVLIGTEYRREMRGDELAQQHIGVRYRQRPAVAIGRRTGIGTGRIRSDAEPAAIRMQDRPAPRGDSVDAHHRGADADTGHFGVKRPFIFARRMRHVGRGAAHVKADNLGVARLSRRLHHADHATRRAGQDRVLALKPAGPGQPTRRHHELQCRPGLPGGGCVQGTADPVDIAPQDRRQIGIDHRGITAPDQFDQRRNLVTDRNLIKAERSHMGRQCDFVGGIFPCMHQHNGHGIDPGGPGPGQGMGQGMAVNGQRGFQRSVGAHPFVDVDHCLVKLFRQDDLFGENIRAGLIGQPQCIAETLGDQQQAPLALALQQRIGGHRGAHFDRADQVGRRGVSRAGAEQPADPFDRRIGVGTGVFGQEFIGVQLALRVAADDVGEGATPVDPEIPCGHGPSLCCGGLAEAAEPPAGILRNQRNWQSKGRGLIAGEQRLDFSARRHGRGRACPCYRNARCGATEPDRVLGGHAFGNCRGKATVERIARPGGFQNRARADCRRVKGLGGIVIQRTFVTQRDDHRPRPHLAQFLCGHRGFGDGRDRQSGQRLGFGFVWCDIVAKCQHPVQQGCCRRGVQDGFGPAGPGDAQRMQGGGKRLFQLRDEHVC